MFQYRPCRYLRGGNIGVEIGNNMLYLYHIFDISKINNEFELFSFKSKNNNYSNLDYEFTIEPEVSSPSISMCEGVSRYKHISIYKYDSIKDYFMEVEYLYKLTSDKGKPWFDKFKNSNPYDEWREIQDLHHLLAPEYYI